MNKDYQVTFMVVVTTDNKDEAEELARQHIKETKHFEAIDIKEI